MRIELRITRLEAVFRRIIETGSRVENEKKGFVKRKNTVFWGKKREKMESYSNFRAKFSIFSENCDAKRGGAKGKESFFRKIRVFRFSNGKLSEGIHENL